MARGRRTVSRMEKSVSQGHTPLPGHANSIQTIQLDGGEVEAQVKRIMLSIGEQDVGKAAVFKLGLFQFTPSFSDFAQDEAIVISGAVGNQCWHNETITMRVPKDWYLGLLFENLDATDGSILTWNLQLNYKVLN